VRRILYLGWIGFHNLGDEWMWLEFERMAKQYLSSDEYEVIPSLPGVDIKDLAPYDTVVLGGGSLLIPGYVDLVYGAMKDGKRIIIWGSGFDQMFKPGNSPEGGEFRNPERESDAYLTKLRGIVENAAYCGVRGPWTYQYLDERGVLLDRVEVSGDPAMMSQGQAVLQDRGADRVIAVNWGTSNGKIFGGNEAAAEEQMAEACRQLVQRGYKLYLYVVWGPDRKPTQQLYDHIASPYSVTYDPEVRTLEDWLGRMPRFDAAINLKLHANVLSAVCHVPFVNLGYRFKSFDFAHALGLQRWTVPTDALDLRDRIVRLTEEGIASQDVIRAQITKAQEQTRENLSRPFKERLF
jgi:hypothetical protein